MNQPMRVGGNSYRQRVSHVKMIIAGATPKETTSDRESNSLPIGETTFSIRAANPSRKSKTAAMMIQMEAISRLPFRAAIADRVPHTRFRQVSVLGMCFFILLCR